MVQVSPQARCTPPLTPTRVSWAQTANSVGVTQGDCFADLLNSLVKDVANDGDGAAQVGCNELTNQQQEGQRSKERTRFA